MNNYDKLLRRAWAGCRRHYGVRLTSAKRRLLVERLSHEISLLRKCGGGSHLLLAADIAEYAKSRRIQTGLGAFPRFDRLGLMYRPADLAHLLLAYGLGLSKLDPIRFGLYPESLLHDDRPLQIRIAIDPGHVADICERFAVGTHARVQVVACRRCGELALLHRLTERTDLELPHEDQTAYAELNLGGYQGPFQAFHVVERALVRPIWNLDELAEACAIPGHMVGAPPTVLFDETIIDAACSVGYSVADAILLVKRLRDGQSDLIGLERQRFVRRSAAQGMSSRQANMTFDTFLSGTVPKSSALAQAAYVYRSLFVKVHHPVDALTTTLTWRGCPMGIVEDDPLLAKFTALGVRLTRHIEDAQLVDISGESATVTIRLPNCELTEVDRIVYKCPITLLKTAKQLISAKERELTASGRGFNLFEVLDRRTAEEKGHSAFLAALLDPRGRHRRGRLFLDAFFRGMAEAGALQTDGFDALTWTAAVEMATPEDEGRCGRIDLVLLGRAKGQATTAILIENKIYAVDQPRQIRRYINAAENWGWQWQCLYLTLDGHAPSEESLDNANNPASPLGPQVACISYEDHIWRWLAHCRSLLTSEMPIIEGIEQYQRLLAELTNMRTELDMQLKQAILESPENVEAAFAISDALAGVKADIQLAFWQALLKELADRHAKPQTTATDQAVTDYYKGSRGAKHFGVSLASTAVEGLQIELVVEHNLYYRWTRNGEPFLACVDDSTEADNQGLTEWSYPKHRLNFMAFGEDCQKLADRDHLEATVAEYAREFLSILGALEQQGRG